MRLAAGFLGSLFSRDARAIFSLLASTSLRDIKTSSACTVRRVLDSVGGLEFLYEDRALHIVDILFFVILPNDNSKTVVFRIKGYRRGKKRRVEVVPCMAIFNMDDSAFFNVSCDRPNSRRFTRCRVLRNVWLISPNCGSYMNFHTNATASSGVRIPEDMSVIGFDNMPVSMRISPQLTTVAQDLKQKAALTVEILQRRLQNPDAPAESRVLDVRLIVENRSKTYPCDAGSAGTSHLTCRPAEAARRGIPLRMLFVLAARKKRGKAEFSPSRQAKRSSPALRPAHSSAIS